MIDLGGVHRLVDQALAEKWYGLAPGAWSYGLPEVHPAEGPLIANPGCYATATLLALWPLRDATEGDIVVDAKSGMTGAGKTLRDSSHAGAVLENFSPYAVGGHRHAPEISQTLGLPVTFVPHLLPVRRGLLATCYVRSSADVRALSRRPTRAAPSSACCPRASSRRSRACRGPTAPRSASSPTVRPGCGS